jgi:hypothetical protein
MQAASAAHASQKASLKQALAGKETLKIRKDEEELH